MDVATATAGAEIIEWVSQYGYIALLLLFIIEGPVTGIVSGVLISIGTLKFWPVFFLYVLGTLISDSVLYFLTKNSENFIRRFRIGRWVLNKINDILDDTESDWRRVFIDNYVSLMIFARLAPINLLSQFVVMTAGVLQIPTRRFYLPILIAQPIWSAMVIGTGYYFGSAIVRPEQMLLESTLYFLLAVLLFFLYRRFMHTYIQKGFLGKVLSVKSKKGDTM